MSHEAVMIETRVLQTRTFTVSELSAVFQLLRDMKQDRFSGKIVVIMSQGGLNAVTAEESKKLPV